MKKLALSIVAALALIIPAQATSYWWNNNGTNYLVGVVNDGDPYGWVVSTSYAHVLSMYQKAAQKYPH